MIIILYFDKVLLFSFIYFKSTSINFLVVQIDEL